MKVIKKYTVKEWKKLQNLQEFLCKKYDVILTDHKTNKEQLVLILKNINLKNINKGIDTFNKIIQDFGGSMEKLTSEIDKTSRNNVKIWSDIPENEPESQKSKDQINLEKIWGKEK
jgi:hypothetical protein